MNVVMKNNRSFEDDLKSAVNSQNMYGLATTQNNFRKKEVQ